MVARTQFARRLHTDRLAAGWTQAELAKQAGIHFTTVSKIESGQRKVERSDSADTVIKLAQALGQPPRDYLILAGHVLPQDEPGLREVIGQSTELTDAQKTAILELVDRFTGQVR